MADGTMDAPKEISIHSGSNENNFHVETVIEPDGASDGNDEEDEGFQGNVAAHNTPATIHRNRQRQPSIGSGSAVHSDSNSASSSWASNDDLRRQKKQQRKTQRGKKWSSIKKNRSQKETMSSPPTDCGFPPPRSDLRRTKTPTTNNLSTASGGFFSEHDDSIEGEDLTASLLPPTVILDGEMGSGRGAVFSNQTRGRDKQQQNSHKPQQQEQPSSYRKWLSEGMLETLNVVAGITLSTTGTILSPPIAMTRNIILPSLLAILVDTLDAFTPNQVQDWFRILSSSVYHFFVVLVAGSTDRGMRFRNQVTRVAQSSLAAWSAPESRQVVVDGMATGVKLADALHTPEMKVFLDQLGVFGCRFVDAMASGKSKEFLLNCKDLAWTSIELACDPSATLAWAEVTAHLCHALKEVDDSYNDVTPRAVRNAHNERTYLNSSLMTKDSPSESMEKIILSSLGMDGNHNNNHDDNNTNESIRGSIDIGYDINDGMDHNSTEPSIPSNVAFRVEEGAGSNTFDIPNPEQTNRDKKYDNNSSNWEKCKERVDLDLLKKKIIDEGRPQARQKALPVSRLPLTNASENKEHRGYQGASGDIGEDYAKIEEDMEELPLPRDSRNPPINIDYRNPTNVKELYDKFERMETKESEKPSHVQFFNALDELFSKNQMKKELNKRDYAAVGESEGDEDSANPQAGYQERKAKVRILRKGIAKEEKSGSKAIREKYANFRRRLWKYPPSLLRFSAVVVLFVCVFWIGFGMYGMYTLFHQVVYFDRGIAVPPINHELLHPIHHHQHHQPPPMHEFDRGQRLQSSNTNRDNQRNEENTSNYRPNEIVIRIVKEVVHVREDGSRIENYKKASEGNVFNSDFSQEDKDDGKEIENSNNSNENDLTTGNLCLEVGEDDNSIKSSEDVEKEDLFGTSTFSRDEIDRVKECVISSLKEVEDDGSSSAIEDYENAVGDVHFASALSQEEIDRVEECVASY